MTTRKGLALDDKNTRGLPNTPVPTETLNRASPKASLDRRPRRLPGRRLNRQATTVIQYDLTIYSRILYYCPVAGKMNGV